MLVLSRKEFEKIFVGNDITIVVVRIRGDVVRIGIEAPLDLDIIRPDARDKRPNHRKERRNDR